MNPKRLELWAYIIGAVLVGLLLWAWTSPAQGHHPYQDAWFDTICTEYEPVISGCSGVMTLELAQARLDYYAWLTERELFEELNGPYTEPRLTISESVTTPPAQVAPVPAGSSYVEGVEQFRSLVAAYFPAERVEEALAVMSCESRGNPNAKNKSSTAAGLMQFLRGTWDRHAPALGLGSYDSGAVYDPEANIRAAAYLGSLYEAEGRWFWGAWACKRVLN